MSDNIFVIIRRKYEVSQKQMDVKCNLYDGCWRKYENNTKIKSRDIVRKIATVLKVNPNLLYAYLEKKKCPLYEQALKYNKANPFVQGIAGSIIQAIQNNNNGGSNNDSKN